MKSWTLTILLLFLLCPFAVGQEARRWSRASEYIERPTNDNNRQQRIERAAEHCQRILNSAPQATSPFFKLLRIVGKRQDALFAREGAWLRDQYGALDVLLVATSRVIEKGLPPADPPTFKLTRDELKKLTYRFTPGTTDQNLAFRAGALRLLGMAIVDGEQLATEEIMKPIDRLLQPRRRRQVSDALKVQELFDKLSEYVSNPEKPKAIKTPAPQRKKKFSKKYLLLFLILLVLAGVTAFHFIPLKKEPQVSKPKDDLEVTPPSSSLQELLDGLAALHAECIHSLKGRLATAEVFRDEPERFGAHFLKEETLGELIEDLQGDDGPKARIDKLLAQKDNKEVKLSAFMLNAFTKLADHRSFYTRLVEILLKVQRRQSEGKEIDVERFMEGIRRLAAQLKSISEALKGLLARFELDLGQLLTSRATALLPQSLLSTVDIQENLIRRTAAPVEEKSEMSKLFDILLTNALETKPQKIELFGESNFVDGQEYLHFVIKDDGAGATEEAIEKAFQRGFTTRKEGTGTGLWWSRRFVESRQGTIELTSEGEGKGAQLTLNIPSLL